MDNESENSSEDLGPIERDGPEDGTAPALRYCPKCSHDVVPDERGRCPTHTIFLAGNQASRKHPVSVARKRELLDKIRSDYVLSTVGHHSTAEQVASVMERLEGSKPGSIEWQRLITGLSTLLAELRPVARPAADLETMTDEQFAEHLEAHAAECLAAARMIRSTPDPAAERPEAAPAADPGFPAPSEAETDRLGGPEARADGGSREILRPSRESAVVASSAENRPDIEPEPEEVFAWRGPHPRRVTEQDVHETIAQLGDDALRAYLNGTGMSRDEAYELAAARLRDIEALRHGRG
jgi:hypothetical protein